MYKRVIFLITVLIGFTLIPWHVHAAAPFYEGKAIRIIVGMSPGGGYDMNARLIARHLGKHIPGHPIIFVDNMPGAGSLVSANYLYKVAKPDGLTIGHFNGGLFLNQVLSRPGVEFDAWKFEYIGAVAQDFPVVALTKVSGITSIEKWLASKTPVKLGGEVPGTFNPDNVTKILKATLGLPIHLVSGYKGSADIRLAAESGELAGGCWGWYSMRMMWRKALDTGDVVPILQAVPKPLPDLPNVPLAINLAKTEEARQLIEMGIHSNIVYSRPLVLPPGTPKERVEVLRKALLETLKDKEFLADAEKANLGLDPVTGEELGKTITGLFKLDPAMLAKLSKIIYE